MTGGGPAHSTEVLASYIYTRSFQQFELLEGASLSVIPPRDVPACNSYYQQDVSVENIEH